LWTAGFNGPLGRSGAAGGEEMVAGEGGHGGQGHEDERAVEEGDDLRMGGTAVGAQGLEAEMHGEVELDEIAGAPLAFDFGEATGDVNGIGLAVDGDLGSDLGTDLGTDLGGRGLVLGPFGDAEVKGEGGGAGGAEMEPYGFGLGVAGFLLELEAGGLGGPFESGGEVEVDPDGRVSTDGAVAGGTEEVGVDAVVGGDLGEGSGAAGPAVGGVNAAGGVAVIGVVEGVAVALHGSRAEGGVEHDALHAVAVVAVAGGLEEITG